LKKKNIKKNKRIIKEQRFHFDSIDGKKNQRFPLLPQNKNEEGKKPANFLKLLETKLMFEDKN